MLKHYKGFIKEGKIIWFVKSKNIFERMHAIYHGKKKQYFLPVILSGWFLVTVTLSRLNFILTLTNKKSELRIQCREVIRRRRI